MSGPIWNRHRIVVDVDVQAVDERGYSFFVGSREAARLAVHQEIFKDERIGDMKFDEDGRYVDSCHRQIRIRAPKNSEEA